MNKQRACVCCACNIESPSTHLWSPFESHPPLKLLSKIITYRHLLMLSSAGSASFCDAVSVRRSMTPVVMFSETFARSAVCSLRSMLPISASRDSQSLEHCTVQTVGSLWFLRVTNLRSAPAPSPPEPKKVPVRHRGGGIVGVSGYLFRELYTRTPDTQEFHLLEPSSLSSYSKACGVSVEHMVMFTRSRHLSGYLFPFAAGIARPELCSLQRGKFLRKVLICKLKTESLKRH